MKAASQTALFQPVNVDIQCGTVLDSFGVLDPVTNTIESYSSR